MEILIGITIILLLGGLYQIQKKLDFLEQRINEVESNLEEEIKNYGIDKYPDLDPYGAVFPGDEDKYEIDMELYEKAKKLVLESGKTYASFLQKKLQIGYARAHALLEKMEEDGILSPMDGAKPRKILKKDN